MNHQEKVDFLTTFQLWMNKVAETCPMQLETDPDDVAMMFLDCLEANESEMFKMLMEYKNR